MRLTLQPQHPGIVVLIAIAETLDMHSPHRRGQCIIRLQQGHTQKGQPLQRRRRFLPHISQGHAVNRGHIGRTALWPALGLAWQIPNRMLHNRG